MNSKAAVGFLAVLAAFVVLIGWVKKRATELDTENEVLRVKVEELQKALAQANAKQGTEKIETLAQPEKLELMRLRNEVTQLRASNQALSKLEAENVRLAAEVQRVQARSSSSEKPPGIGRAQWNFQGHATPEAAYMSGMWAQKEGQIETFLASLTPEQRQRFETENQGKSADEIVDRVKRGIDSVTALRVADRRQVSPTEVVLDTQVYISPNNRIGSRSVRMNLIGNEWKAADAIDQNEDPLAFYRKNPQLMKRYFPHMFKEGATEQETAAKEAVVQRYGLQPAVE